MAKKVIGILMGGSSVEREVSFKSAENILDSIDKNKYDVVEIELPSDKSDIGWTEKLKRVDLVLSALHGGIGENGSVQGLLHCMNIPYVGSKVTSSALCMDKHISKQIMSYNHIPVVDDIYFKRGEDITQYYDEVGKLGFPLIVKPNRGGSSIGIEVVEDINSLTSAIKNIIDKYDDDVLIEKYIKAKEATCCVLQTKEGLKVMAVLDINKKGDFYDYNAKYVDDRNSADFSELPKYMQTMVMEIAKKVFEVLMCRGYVCVDMLIKEEQIYVIEVNTLPGLTKHSLIPRAVESMGISFGEFLEMLVE